MKRWANCYDDSWKGVITPDAFAHPAKFSKALVERILDYMLKKSWIEKGDLIADPFAGVGCGGVVATYRGFRWIGVELERTFWNLALDNFARHAYRWSRMGAVLPIVMPGDSRLFDRIICPFDAVVSSPPYVSGGHHTDAMEGGNRNGRGQQIKAIVTSPPHGPSLDDGGPETAHPDGYKRTNNWSGYGKSEGQIGKLKAGEVDAVVSSPPFLGARSDTTNTAGGISRAGYSEGKYPSDAKVGERTFRSGAGDHREPENIETLKPGEVSAVITSPPYETISAGAGGLNTKPAKKTGQQSGRRAGPSQTADTHYGKTEGQIANTQKRDIAAVLTSPPYEDSVNSKSHGIDFAKSKPDYPGRKNHPERNAKHSSRAKEMIYGSSTAQIGSKHGETYWEAMSQVYGACYRALKPGGVMAIVVKDYVKDKKRVPLCDDTMKLLVHIGFTPLERVAAMLVQESAHEDLFVGTVTKSKSRKSFWRRLSESKGSPKIDYEEVLFVRKPI